MTCSVWIAYGSIDARANHWFIDELIKALQQLGVSAELKLREDFQNNVKDELSREKLPDILVNRCRDASISETLSHYGIPSVNNADVVRIANDKWLTYEFLRSHGIACVETHLLSTYPYERSLGGCRDGVSLESISYPLVLKDRSGHGGADVIYVEDAAELQKAVHDHRMSNFIFQPFVESGSEDHRLYIIDKKVKGAVCRRSKQGEFRSNFKLGGEVFELVPTEEEISCAIECAEFLDADYIGVDFIKDKGKWVVNEIEDAVGARMLFCIGKGVGIISSYASLIAAKLKAIP